MSWIKSPIVIIVLSQLLFSFSDLLARHNLKDTKFSISVFFSLWFLTYFIIRQLGMVGQLYVFTSIEVGKTMALFGASSIMIVNILGILLLGEVLSVQAYVGVAIAVLAFIILAYSP